MVGQNVRIEDYTGGTRPGQTREGRVVETGQGWIKAELTDGTFRCFRLDRGTFLFS
jgi:hypothetical protein